MRNYQNAGQGLKLMFLSKIGAIICTVALLIPFVNLFAIIGAFILMIIELVGLYIAGKDLSGCRTAFLFLILELVIRIFERIFRTGLLGSIFSLVESIFSLLAIYYVCASVNEALCETGNYNVAKTGNTVWKINLACFIISAVITVLALVPIINILAGIATFLVVIVACIGSILYLIYLNGSYRALQ